MTSTNTSHKITETHRAKFAYVYIRQSTPSQLVHHAESTRRQYELVDRAVVLGWVRLDGVPAAARRGGAAASGNQGDEGQGSEQLAHRATALARPNERSALLIEIARRADGAGLYRVAAAS